MKQLKTIIILSIFMFSNLTSIGQTENSLKKIENTSQFPHNSVCQLEVKRKSIKTLWLWKKQYQSTGFFIRQNVILTNAHNVYSNFFSNAVSIKINPGKNLDNNPIEETMIMDRVKMKKYVRTPPEYKFRENWKQRANYDYALIFLPNHQSRGEATFEIIDCDSVFHKGEPMFILGYPGKTKRGKEQFHSSGNLIEIEERVVKYTAWTETGNSGSPVLIKSDKKYFVIGVHAFPKLATKINQKVIDRLNEWIYSFN